MSDSALHIDSPQVNPWRAIWFYPSRAMQSVLGRRSELFSVLAAIFGGIAVVLLHAITYFGQINLSLQSMVILGAIAGPLLGLVAIYLNAALLRISGAWLGGKASAAHLRTALAWAQVPMMTFLLIMLALLGFAAIETASRDADQRQMLQTVLGVGLAIGTILQLWSALLSIRTIGAAQSFGVLRSLANIILAVMLTLPFALAIRIFAFQPFNIPSSSMAPTLTSGDYLFASKFAYGYGRYSFPIDLGFSGRVFDAEPKRGDIIIFRLHNNPTIDYVKRVIGLPGDEVAVVNGAVVLNGQTLAQDDLGPATVRSSDSVASGRRYQETLPDGRSYEIFFSEPKSMGDTGVSFKVPQGAYFALGDNRNNSSDSRHSQVGFIYHDDLVGRASVIFYHGAQSGQGVGDEPRMFTIPR